MLSADHMCSLPQFFSEIPDPRRSQGRRHSLSTVLAIATAAVLCGARGYKAISDWSQDTGQKARARFRCRYRDGRYLVPSRTQFREVLIRVDPSALDRALQTAVTIPCRSGGLEPICRGGFERSWSIPRAIVLVRFGHNS